MKQMRHIHNLLFRQSVVILMKHNRDVVECSGIVVKGFQTPPVQDQSFVAGHLKCDVFRVGLPPEAVLCKMPFDLSRQVRRLPEERIRRKMIHRLPGQKKVQKDNTGNKRMMPGSWTKLLVLKKKSKYDPDSCHMKEGFSQAGTCDLA